MRRLFGLVKVLRRHQLLVSYPEARCSTAFEMNPIKNSLVVLFGLAALLGPLHSSAAEKLNWNPPDHSVAVDLPSCDGDDALIINEPNQLKALSSKSFRVFCIAPGDYRSADILEINGVSGSSFSPRVIRLLGSEAESPADLAQAPLGQIALLPPLYFRDAQHWVIDGMGFVDIDRGKGAYPMRFFASSDIVLNRLRVQGNRHGIEFHHLSHDISLQNSLIGDMDMDPKNGNDAVCVAFEGRYTDMGDDVESAVMQNIRVVSNEIYNCNDGVQLIWDTGDKHWPDYSGTLIAGNDIYIDERRLTDCKGNLTPDGNCACTENAIDIKAGAKSPANPVVIRHNRFYGWRKTDSKCNPDAQSWGTAISVHFEAAQHMRIEQNLFWDVASGVSLTKKARAVEIVDNLFHTVPKTGGGNGIAIISYERVSEVNIARNRIVDAHGWLSLLSSKTSLSCNIVNSSGKAIGSLARGSYVESNSYYQHGERTLKSNGDLTKELRDQSGDGELCTTINNLSGPDQLCLAQAVSTSKSNHACDGGYWRGF